MAGPITISILANARPAVQGMHQVSESATGMGKKLGGVGRGIAAGFATMGTAIAAAGVVEGFKKIIDESASLTAAIGTTKAIFRDASGDMLTWSETAATTLGLSQSEALNATKVFGGFFTGVGIGSQKAADMSKNWTTMAANMAAFGDIPVADSLEAVKSALIGEYDPIQKLIPTLSAASLQQKAMELSGKKNAKALTDQDKAAALNAIMMDSLANKVGAAEREQGGYAVQMDKLKAQFKNVAAAIGGPFLTALTKGGAWINDKLIPGVKDFWSNHGPAITDSFKKAGGALKTAFDASPVKTLFDQFTGAEGKVGGLSGTFASIKSSFAELAKSDAVGSIIENAKTGLASLMPAFTDAFNNLMPVFSQVGETLSGAFSKALPQIQAILGTLGTIVGQAFEAVRAVVSAVVTVILTIWQNFGANILAYLSTAFAAVVSALQGAFTMIKGIFDVIIGVLTGDWGRAWDGVKSIVSGAVQFVVGIFTLLKAQIDVLGQAMDAILAAVWNAIKAGAIAAWTAIKAALVSAWNGIKAAISAGVAGVSAFVASGWESVKSATANAWNAVKSATSNAWNALKGLVSSAINGVKSAVSSGVSAVVSALTSAWNAAKSATIDAWNAVKSAVTTGVSNVISVVKGLGGKVKGAISGAASWLVGAGRDLIQGMINGVAQMAGALASKARAVVSSAVNAAKGALGISSPSKVFLRLGKLSVAGLIEGLETGRDDIKKTVTKLVDDVVDAFPTSIKKTFAKGTKISVIDAWKRQEAAAGKKRATTRNALLDRIKADNAKLLTLAGKRDTVADKLRATNEHLADLQQARAGVVSSVAGVFENSFRLINDAADAGTASIEDVLERSRAAVAQAAEFAAQLKGLATRGVAPEVLQELAMAGPKAGMDTAKALMAGSAEQLKELSENYRAIAKTGQQAGQVVAGHMYDTGIAAAKALAAGYASQQAYLEASILQMIADLNKKIAASVAKVTPRVPKVETNKPIKVEKPKKGAKAGPPKTAESVTVVVNTGVVVDKRGMVDAISGAFNEVSTQLGRPIVMNVAGT